MSSRLIDLIRVCAYYGSEDIIREIERIASDDPETGKPFTWAGAQYQETTLTKLSRATDKNTKPHNFIYVGNERAVLILSLKCVCPKIYKCPGKHWTLTWVPGTTPTFIHMFGTMDDGVGALLSGGGNSALLEKLPLFCHMSLEISGNFHDYSHMDSYTKLLFRNSCRGRICVFDSLWEDLYLKWLHVLPNNIPIVMMQEVMIYFYNHHFRPRGVCDSPANLAAGLVCCADRNTIIYQDDVYTYTLRYTKPTNSRSKRWIQDTKAVIPRRLSVTPTKAPLNWPWLLSQPPIFNNIVQHLDMECGKLRSVVPHTSMMLSVHDAAKIFTKDLMKTARKLNFMQKLLHRYSMLTIRKMFHSVTKIKKNFNWHKANVWLVNSFVLNELPFDRIPTHNDVFILCADKHKPTALVCVTDCQCEPAFQCPGEHWIVYRCMDRKPLLLGSLKDKTKIVNLKPFFYGISRDIEKTKLIIKLMPKMMNFIIIPNENIFLFQNKLVEEYIKPTLLFISATYLILPLHICIDSCVELVRLFLIHKVQNLENLAEICIAVCKLKRTCLELDCNTAWSFIVQRYPPRGAGVNHQFIICTSTNEFYYNQLGLLYRLEFDEDMTFDLIPS
ncbi:ORF12 [Plodia interpunctella granulovirus]|uniref:ORF12 n=1 Tax=Plodia interpunctella granulovirus TaxID=262175 RepID=A0A1L5JGX7_9BBAC|nr:ORF12 [Plodia interpunctella granulovirus]APO13896.1 ORF12 [Plodia interpunctella granulovirus]